MLLGGAGGPSGGILILPGSLDGIGGHISGGFCGLVIGLLGLVGVSVGIRILLGYDFDDRSDDLSWA